MDLLDRFANWNQRIHALQRHSPERRLFGSELHRFERGARLAPNELEALQSGYGVTLPSDYRDYLLHFGNGGVGPGYGVIPLLAPGERAPARKRAETTFTLKDGRGELIKKGRVFDVGASYDSDGRTNSTDAAKPFPLAAPFRVITAEMAATPFHLASDEMKAEHAANKAAFFSLPFGHGVLKVADYGSGIYGVIVLHGPFAGQVWITDPFAGDYVPASYRVDLHDHTIKTSDARKHEREPTTFIPWYEDWLAAAERQMA